MRRKRYGRGEKCSRVRTEALGLGERTGGAGEG